jgi:hypothetical protein
MGREKTYRIRSKWVHSFRYQTKEFRHRADALVASFWGLRLWWPVEDGAWRYDEEMAQRDAEQDFERRGPAPRPRVFTMSTFEGTP